jgi:hypothetical protein
LQSQEETVVEVEADEEAEEEVEAVVIEEGEMIDLVITVVKLVIFPLIVQNHAKKEVAVEVALVEVVEEEVVTGTEMIGIKTIDK